MTDPTSSPEDSHAVTAQIVTDFAREPAHPLDMAAATIETVQEHFIASLDQQIRANERRKNAATGAVTPQELVKQLEDTESQTRRLSNVVSSQEAQIARLWANLNLTTTEYDEALTELDQLRAERDQARIDVEQLRNEVRDLKLEASRGQSAIKYLEGAHGAVALILAGTGTEATGGRLAADIWLIAEQRDQARAEIEQLRAAVDTYETENAKLNQQIDNLGRDLGAAEAEHRRLCRVAELNDMLRAEIRRLRELSAPNITDASEKSR